jgi:hypothetical protein
VGIFAMRDRSPVAEPGAPGNPAAADQPALPARFAAVGEALASGSGAVVACGVAGRELARDGVPLEEALDGLSTTYRTVRGGDPDHAVTRALAVAWSEAVLGYLNRLGCEDPLTGLASAAHVRSRLAELYRGQLRGRLRTSESHALVVVDVPPEPGRGPGLVVEQALRAGRVGTVVRTVFAGGETIGRLAGGRLVVLAECDDRIGARIALLRRLVADFDGPGRPSRVWLEPLPASDQHAASLLDGLARG